MWNSVFVSVCGVIQRFETQQFGSVKQYDVAWLRWGEGVGDWCHSCVTCVSPVWSHGHTGHWRHQLEYTQRHIHYILSGNKHQSMLNIIYWRQKCHMPHGHSTTCQMIQRVDRRFSPVWEQCNTIFSDEQYLFSTYQSYWHKKLA